VSDDTEEIEITKCPLCGSKHVYSVEIQKSMIFYHMTANMDTSSKKRTCRRSFTCPEKDETFSGTLTFYEGFGEKIEGVRVK
jgi:hypothetical protein